MSEAGDAKAQGAGMLDFVHGRMSILQRMTLIGGVMLVPIALLANLFWTSEKGNIDFTEAESDGVDYLNALWPLMAAQLGEGEVSYQALTAARAAYDEAFGTAEASSAVIAQAQDLDREAKLNTMLALAIEVGDQSNLVLDPDLDSYYVMDAVVQKMPGLLPLILELEKRANAFAAAGDTQSSARLDLLVTQVRLLAQAEAVDAAWNAAFGASPDQSVSRELAVNRQAFNAAIESLNEKVDAVLASGGDRSDLRDLREAEEALLEASDAAWRASSATLTRLLDARSSAARDKLYLNLGISGALIMLAALLTLLISRGMSTRFNVLVATMNRLREGDLRVDTPFMNDTNESGKIAIAVADFKRTLVANRELEIATAAAKERAAEEERIARERAAADRADQLKRTTDTFESSVSGAIHALLGEVGVLQTSAGTLRGAVTESKSSAEQLEGSARSSAEDVAAMAAASEELSMSINAITNQAQKSAETARASRTQAEAAAAKFKQLNDAAARIGAITTMISDIASRTNLLALNATIEAVRAGEAGRGFAIVASEVKGLASQSHRATEEIDAMIQEINQQTSQALAVIGEIASSVDNLTSHSDDIALAMQEQSSAIREISSRATELANKTSMAAAAASNLRGATDQTASVASDSSAAANALSQQAKSLESAAAQFLQLVRAG